MEKILRYLTVLFFVFFEVYAGIRLLTNPVEFTGSVLVFFGIIMMIIGVLSIVKALRAKSKAGMPYRVNLLGGILDLIVGVLCAFFTNTVLGIGPSLIRIIGIIMVIAGIHMIRNYLALKDLGIHRSWLVVLSAVISIVLGVFVFLYPLTTADLSWTYVGIFLIVEGVVDLFVFIFSFFL